MRLLPRSLVTGTVRRQMGDLPPWNSPLDGCSGAAAAAATDDDHEPAGIITTWPLLHGRGNAGCRDRLRHQEFGKLLDDFRQPGKLGAYCAGEGFP